ncbi:MAG: A/G-specific adenine glycosylase [Sphingobacteriales bacterium]|nr:MAG: A/G-specific adenine glycosylase [Sphingobacteriales bacterium]
MEGTKRKFTRALMDWHRNENFRVLPWKQEKDPYRIWLSEIILQQTRAEQGLPYYLRFIEAYPDISSLAQAPEEDVFRLWQGLGYYNRCRNLMQTAREVAGRYKSQFPNTYEGLLTLKGIGPYTASAIASFAFGRPHAVVDGNVNRVLSRYFGIETAFDTAAGKNGIQTLATELLDREDSAGYNQAIMDHGATICTPASPKCEYCPLQEDCFAFTKNMVQDLPVKTRKTPVRTRYYNYLLLTDKDRLWIRKRTEKDIWQNLYEPKLIETKSPIEEDEVEGLIRESGIRYEGLVRDQGSFRQKLTHQIIESRFFSLQVCADEMGVDDGLWVAFSELERYAFPKTLVSFLEKKILLLETE